MLAIAVVLFASFVSVVSTYLAIAERDLLVSVLFVSLTGISYTLIYYVLMAPDVVLAYIPVSSVLLPALLFLLIKNTKRYEDT